MFDGVFVALPQGYFYEIGQVYRAGAAAFDFSQASAPLAVQPLVGWRRGIRVRHSHKWTRCGHNARNPSLTAAYYEYLEGERNCGQRTNANQRPPNRLALLGTKLVGKQERDARSSSPRVTAMRPISGSVSSADHRSFSLQ